jgi:hypothetical protein
MYEKIKQYLEKSLFVLVNSIETLASSLLNPLHPRLPSLLDLPHPPGGKVANPK